MPDNQTIYINVHPVHRNKLGECTCTQEYGFAFFEWPRVRCRYGFYEMVADGG